MARAKELVVSKTDDMRRLRREQSDAVAYASEGNWAAAIAANQAMLQATPHDVEALNRLAKAYYESDINPNSEIEQKGGGIAKARELYQQVLEISPANAIAQRMLAMIGQTQKRVVKDRAFINMRQFVIETGKSTLTTIHIDTPGALALVPGEIVYMRIVGKKDPESESVDAIPEDANAIDVYDAGDMFLGRIEPRLAARLIRLMRAHNRYQAAVWRFSDHHQHIEVIIQETYVHPDNRHEVSFPGKLVDENERRMIVDEVEDDGDDSDETDSDDTDEVEPESFDVEEEEHERLDTIESNSDSDEEIED